MVDQISDLKRKVISALDHIFPEYSKLFSDVFGKTSKDLLLNHTTPEEIANLDTSYLTDLLLKLSNGRLGLKKLLKSKKLLQILLELKEQLMPFLFKQNNY